MSWYNGMIVGFDLETTGVDPFRDTPVQIGLSVSVATNSIHIPVPSMGYERLVNPGIPILNSEIHGITDADVEFGWPTEEAFEELAWYLRALVSVGVPIVIYNAAYDWTMLYEHMVYFSMDWDLGSARLIDPFVIDKALDKYRKGSRKLVDTAAVYGLATGDQAHTAQYDADLAVRVARAMVHKYPELERGSDFAPKQEYWALEQQKSLQEYFDKKGQQEKVSMGWPIQEKGASE